MRPRISSERCFWSSVLGVRFRHSGLRKSSQYSERDALLFYCPQQGLTWLYFKTHKRSRAKDARLRGTLTLKNLEKRYLHPLVTNNHPISRPHKLPVLDQQSHPCHPH